VGVLAAVRGAEEAGAVVEADGLVEEVVFIGEVVSLSWREPEL